MNFRYARAGAAILGVARVLTSCPRDSPQSPPALSAAGVSAPATGTYSCDFKPQAQRTPDVRSQFIPANVTRYIKVYVHRLVNGTNNWTAAEVGDAMALLEADFAAGGIYMLQVGSDTPQDPGPTGGGYFLPFLLNNYGASDRVDLFFGSRDGEAHGWGQDTTPFGMVVWGDVPGTHIPGHEVGHVLGLPHTHGAHEQDCPVAVINADSPPVPDTPPDPGLKKGFRLGPGCTYAPPDAATCPILLQYHPDTGNIMSYTALACMDHFTPGQYRVMKESTRPFVVNATVTAAPVHAVCPQGDGDVLTVSVDMDLEGSTGSIGVIDATRLSLGAPAPGSVS